jgi:hypothetical protein
MSAAVRFFCDDHLRRLARWLRGAGFDTAWERAVADRDLLARCRSEERVLLTLDRALAARAGGDACLLPSHDPLEQLRYLRRRYALDLLARAFTRCPVCNEELLPAAPAEVDVPARVREACDRFFRCPRCGRAYWEGDHVRHMRARFLEAAR